MEASKGVHYGYPLGDSVSRREALSTDVVSSPHDSETFAENSPQTPFKVLTTLKQETTGAWCDRYICCSPSQSHSPEAVSLA